ncbi:MAG: DUF2589 domain-containing protein [Polyangiaceae bacterium]
MANGVQDLKSLPLSDIIGAPVSAIVQAEANAARTAIEFIEKVGFQKDADAPDGASALDAGQLRMVEFGYTKPDENGNPAEFVARIPLLALFPIPGIRVSLAKVAFTAKITDAFTETTEDQTTQNTLFEEPQVQFRGALVSNTSTTNTTNASYDLNIALELEQSPVSPGMAKLLSMLDVAISESKKVLPP